MTPQFLSEMPPAQNPNTKRSVTIATKAPPELLRAIMEITQRKDSSYESVSAFVRAAIHRLVMTISRDAEGSLLPPVIALLNEWSREYFQFTCHQQVVEGMENNAKMLEEYIQHGDPDRATETLEAIAKDIMGLNDPYWKKRCLMEFWKFEITKDALKIAGDRAPGAIEAYEAWKKGRME